jgi:nitrite reductase/ring-hydroxylating ferredoxin subunit
MSSSRTPRLTALVDRLAAASVLDEPAQAIGRSVRQKVKPGPAKDVLSGTPLGHPAHPLIMLGPLGSFTSAVALDWLGGRGGRGAADRLIALGLALTPPAVASGWSDWADTELANPSVRRIGLVHALSNATGALLFGGSLVARARGARGTGKALALAGTGALSVGGYLGGHLAYAEGVGVDQTSFDRRPADWTPALSEADVPEGAMRAATVVGFDVLIARHQGRLCALSNRCVHRGAPLDQGTLGDGTVTCPWHGSVFRLEDGSVERGPATYPQPVWETRVVDGTVEVRAPASA